MTRDLSRFAHPVGPRNHANAEYHQRMGRQEADCLFARVRKLEELQPGLGMSLLEQVERRAETLRRPVPCDIRRLHGDVETVQSS